MPPPDDDLLVVWCGTTLTVWGRGSLLVDFVPSIRHELVWACVEAARGGAGCSTRATKRALHRVRCPEADPKRRRHAL